MDCTETRRGCTRPFGHGCHSDIFPLRGGCASQFEQGSEASEVRLINMLPAHRLLILSLVTWEALCQHIDTKRNTDVNITFSMSNRRKLRIDFAIWCFSARSVRTCISLNPAPGSRVEENTGENKSPRVICGIQPGCSPRVSCG